MTDNAVANTITINENILQTVKILLGLRDNTAFDQEMIIHINSVFSMLQQMGVGPKNGFRISTGEEVWSNFIDESGKNLYSDVKDFMYMKVKMIFDPPQSSALIDSYNRQIKEIEYRLYTQSGGY